MYNIEQELYQNVPKIMSTFDIKSIALKWYFLTLASFILYQEFSHLYQKQLGFSPGQIGMTSLFGAQHLFIPLLLFIGDKFRARKLILWIVTIASVACFLLALLPLAVPLPTCFGGISVSNHLKETKSSWHTTYKIRNGSVHSNYFKNDDNSTLDDSTNEPFSKSYQNVPVTSYLFLVMTVSRSTTTFLAGVVLSLASSATVAYLGKERANFGSYLMWAHVGTTISVVGSAAVAQVITISICGNEGYGYFASIIVSTILAVLSMLSLPWLEFKYETGRSVDWTEVKSVIFNGHYVYLYALNFYLGVCATFQGFWEFWYLDGLEASPLVMGGAALIRRPILAMSLFISSYVTNRIGDLYTVCASFLLFALSFLCLSFTRVYWHVLAIDTFQAMGNGLAQSAFTVHFSKAGSRASSGVLHGLQQMCFMGGVDAGTTILGVLFQAIGTRKTLLLYAFVTAIILGILFLYLKCSKHANKYEKLHCDDDDDDDSCGS